MNEEHRGLKDSPWIPLLQEKLPVLNVVNTLKILYEKYHNPFFVWLARVFAKELPSNHPAIDIKWIDDYLDEVEGGILRLLGNPPDGDFAKAATDALGFNPTQKRATPASMARTILHDEFVVAKEVFALLPQIKKYIAEETVAASLGISKATVVNAVNYRRRHKRRP